MLSVAFTLKFSYISRMSIYIRTKHNASQDVQRGVGLAWQVDICAHAHSETAALRESAPHDLCRCAVRVRLNERRDSETRASRKPRAASVDRRRRTNQRCPPREQPDTQWLTIYIRTFMHILVWTAFRV